MFPFGRFSSDPETDDLGVLPPAFPNWATFQKTRLFSPQNKQPQEMAVG
jgi:hypothetical protein